MTTSAGRTPRTVLLVDVANVVGSRPDGWWRDRAGAARRLLEFLTPLPGTTVPHPDGVGPVYVAAVRAVVEGAAGVVTAPAGIDVVVAPRDGDSELVAQARRLVAAGDVPLVVTADRGLRARLPEGSVPAGPQWLNRLVGR